MTVFERDMYVKIKTKCTSNDTLMTFYRGIIKEDSYHTLKNKSAVDDVVGCLARHGCI